MTLTPMQDLQVASCDDRDALLKEALAARPDVRAAELSDRSRRRAHGTGPGAGRCHYRDSRCQRRGHRGLRVGSRLRRRSCRSSPAIPAAARGRPRRCCRPQARYLACARAWTKKCARPSAILARARDVVAVWEGETRSRSKSSGARRGSPTRPASCRCSRSSMRIGASVTIRMSGLDARRDLLNAAAALDQAIGRSCALK